jgi:hypothetical protein
MRFDLLFDDLESQLETQLDADAAQHHIEEERLRAARTSMRERLAALARGCAGGIRMRLVGGSAIEVAPTAVGADWLAGELPGGAEAIVPVAAVASLSLSAAQVRASRVRMPEPERPDLTARLAIGVVLRDLARRRVAVDVLSPLEPAALHGTIDRVGADHLDLAVHARGDARREGNVVEHRVLALSAVAMVRVG